MLKHVLLFLPVIFSCCLVLSQTDKNLESKLNYCAYENSLLEAENKKLKDFTGRQHREIRDLKFSIFDYQSKIHAYQIDSIKISKAPIALLKLASFIEQERNYDQAMAIYKLLIDVYPNRDESDKAREKLNSMNHWINKK